MEAVKVEISKLREFPRNSRVHPPKNLAVIRDSLTRLGQYRPLLVQSGTDIVIAGNGRLAVMRELGWKEADVVYADVTDEEALLINMADNKTSELSTWNSRLIEKMKSFGPDVISALGFTVKELKQFEEVKADLGKFRGGGEGGHGGGQSQPEFVVCPCCGRRFMRNK